MSDRIIFALIGAIIGGIAGGIFVGCTCCKEYKKKIMQLEEENSELRIRRRKAKEVELKEKEEELNRAQKKAQDIIEEEGYSVIETSDAIFDSDDDVDFDDPFEEDSDGEEVVVKEEEEKKPSFSLMTQKEYEDDFQFRESESLTFYQSDKVLADAFDDRVGNPERIIGREALSEAEMTDDDYVYVMDEVEDKMYEIEINHEESYYRDILRGGGE